MSLRDSVRRSCFRFNFRFKESFSKLISSGRIPLVLLPPEVYWRTRHLLLWGSATSRDFDCLAGFNSSPLMEFPSPVVYEMFFKRNSPGVATASERKWLRSSYHLFPPNTRRDGVFGVRNRSHLLRSETITVFPAEVWNDVAAAHEPRSGSRGVIKGFPVARRAYTKRR